MSDDEKAPTLSDVEERGTLAAAEAGGLIISSAGLEAAAAFGAETWDKASLSVLADPGVDMWNPKRRGESPCYVYVYEGKSTRCFNIPRHGAVALLGEMLVMTSASEWDGEVWTAEATRYFRRGNFKVIHDVP